MRNSWLVYLSLAITVSGAAVDAATVTVHVANFSFTQQFVTINRGDTVHWVLDSGMHTVTSDDGRFTSSGTPMLTSYDVTFPDAGSFPYHCFFHGAPGSGMFGAVTVSKDNTTTGLTTSNNTTIYGQSATLTAIVTANPPASGTPTGTVTFFDGASPFCTNVALNGSATATCSTAPLSAGTHGMTAMYNGDSSFSPSTSNTVQQMVSQASSTTTLNSSPNPSGGNLVVTFTATVTIDSPGSGTPTGIVRFKEGATQLCPDVILTSGTAQCLTSALSPGTHSVTAQYLGDGNVVGSTSNAIQQVVHVPPAVPPAFHAEASDANTVGMGWQSSTGADSYEVFRRSNINGALTMVAQTTGLAATDSMLPADTTFLYQVRAVSTNGVSLLSPIDPATTVMFLAPGPPASNAAIHASEMTQVRKAVKAMCVATNATFPAVTETLTANVTPIRGSHVLELRTPLNNARTNIGLSALTFTGPITANATVILPIHLTELYAGTQ